MSFDQSVVGIESRGMGIDGIDGNAMMLIYPACTVAPAGVDALWQDGTWSAESKYDGTLLPGSQDPVNIRNNSNSGKDFFSSGQQVRWTVNFQFQQPKRWQVRQTSAVGVSWWSSIQYTTLRTHPFWTKTRCALYPEISYPATCLLSRYASPQQLKGAHTAKSDDVWCARCSSKSFVCHFDEDRRHFPISRSAHEMKMPKQPTNLCPLSCIQKQTLSHVQKSLLCI